MKLKRLARGVFKCFRTSVVVLLLTIAVLGLFLNKVGLPEFLKARVISQARARGWQVEFSRLRLRWYRGLVAEDLHITSTNGSGGPQLFVEEAECPLNPAALKNFTLKMNSLRLRGGRLVWPLMVTNAPPRTFVLNDLNGLLLLLQDGRWELPSLSGDFHGIKLDLAGSIANPRMIRHWQAPPRARRGPRSTETLLHELETLVSGLKLADGSSLRLKFDGDGKDLSSMRATVFFRIPGLASPWGTGTNLVLVGELLPPSETNDVPMATFKLAAAHPETPWGKARSARVGLSLKSPLAPLATTEISVTADLVWIETAWSQAAHLAVTAHSLSNPTNGSLVETKLAAQGRQLHGNWGEAAEARLNAMASHSTTNVMPADLSMDLVLNTLHTRWGNAQGGEIRASSSLPSRENFQLFKSNVVWPERLANLPFQATAEFTNLDSTQIDLKNISLHLESRAPQITFDSSGRIGDGNFNLNGQLDTSTREVSFAGSSRIDPRKMASLLSTNSQRSLANYSFESPPALEAQGRLILPAWTNRHPDWKGETMPSMVLAGRFEAGPGSYRGVPFSSAQSPFSLTNLLWQLPSLKLTRPEGSLEAEYSSHPLTRDFHWRVRSQIDPLIAKPLFQNEMTKRALDFFQFTTPPAIQADIWGNWGDADRLGAVAQVAATNFAFRGEAVKDCQTRLHYTNKVFVFTECRLQRERGEQGVLQGITLDLDAQKIYLTNGFSTLDPYAVARAISKPAIAAIAPYQFDSPPTIRFDGDIDLKRHRYEEDMHFAVFGNQFHWQQFHLEQLLGKVDWVGQTVTLTNMVGSLKTGRLAGDARFDFTRSRQADFTLKTIFEKADLREIAAPFSGKTNKLEGVLSGELFVTRANTGDSRTWQGVGRLNLQDGLIWDIPMFGLFSPILNGFLPGLGNSRANEADATFILTNGVFVSKDLEIHATMMRMQFKGAVGLNRRVDARVEAELLRDLPAIGVVISKVFWPVTKLFEYKVTGTLSEPKAEPLYILPKILLMPFHPFKALRNMLNEEPKEEEKKPAP